MKSRQMECVSFLPLGVLMQTLIIKICCWQDFQLDTIHINAKDRSYSN